MVNAPETPPATLPDQVSGGPAASAEVRRPTSLALLCATAVLPALLVLVCDLIYRRELLTARAGPPVAGYVGGAILSMAVWGLVLEAARHPHRAVRVVSWVVLGVTASLGVGGQLVFFRTTHELFNRDAAIFSIKLWPTIWHFLLTSPLASAAVLLGPAALIITYGIVRHRLIGPRQRYARVGALLALAVCLFAAFGPLTASAAKRGLPPEVLFWHAAGGLGLYAAGVVPKPRTLPPGRHEALPPAAQPVTSSAPSVLLVFGESVRRDEVCSRRSADCTKSPAVDAAAPERIGFRHSFAVASCTEISAAILWTGLPIRSTAETIQAAPLLWDYAKSRGYRTAYISSHNLSFGNQGLFVATSRIDVKREARDRAAHVDLDLGTPDEDSAAEALAFLTEGGPAFAVLHLSNTHLPYRQVEGHAPHPADGDEAAARRARYLNSLVHQDAVVGDLVSKLRATERGKNTIVIYTADHGEAWGEHNSYSHTFDLYAEQIDVPLWVDVPEGALSAGALAHLREAADSMPTFTADVSATVLDLLGALDEPAFGAKTARLAGASALRPAPGPRDIELSNCPPFRSCFPDAWGLVRWPMKYHYVGRAFRSACSDLRADPTEAAQVSPALCVELRDEMYKHYGMRPDGSYPDWRPPAVPPASKGSR